MWLLSQSPCSLAGDTPMTSHFLSCKMGTLHTWYVQEGQARLSLHSAVSTASENLSSPYTPGLSPEPTIRSWPRTRPFPQILHPPSPRKILDQLSPVGAADSVACSSHFSAAALELQMGSGVLAANLLRILPMHSLHREQASRCLGVSTAKLCDSCAKKKSSHPWTHSYLSAKWGPGSADVCLTTASQDSQ